jgi:hypothetical protein
MEATTTVITEKAYDKILKADNKGALIAGILLLKIRSCIHLISKDQALQAEVPNDIDPKGLLMKRIQSFNKYAKNIPPERLASGWWKHYGAIRVPWDAHGGNIHLYLLDDGLLSDSIPKVPAVNYRERSAFFLNRVIGLDVESQRLKGRMHLHVINIRNLEGNDLMAIKRYIAHEHESAGNYIPNTSMVAFSLKQLCPNGGELEDIDFLAINPPDWFERQIPKWKM